MLTVAVLPKGGVVNGVGDGDARRRVSNADCNIDDTGSRGEAQIVRGYRGKRVATHGKIGRHGARAVIAAAQKRGPIKN